MRRGSALIWVLAECVRLCDSERFADPLVTATRGSGLLSKWVRRRIALADELVERGDERAALLRVRRAQYAVFWSGDLALKRALLTWATADSNEDVEDPKALVRRAARMGFDDPGLLVRCADVMVSMGAVDEIEPWVARAEDLAAPCFALDNEL